MKTHKVILGTPRSGSSFVTRWFANKHQDYTALSENQGYEHFEPGRPSWPPWRS